MNLRVIITGTNGMIGNLLLERCLASHEVTEITSITRKSVGIKHPKLTELIIPDFTQLDQHDTYFTNRDVCFYCLGVYTGQVPEAEFINITVNLPAIFAKKLIEKSPNLRFVLLSGQGADQSEKSNILFAKQKGRIENILLNYKFKGLHLFRPGYIYPVAPREEPNLFYKIMRYLYKPISFIYPNIGLTSIQLANKMFEIGMKGSEKIIFENKDIKEISTS